MGSSINQQRESDDTVRAFWNDEHGLTLNEWVAMVVMIMWAIVTIIITVYMVLGELTDRMIDFYSVLGWMPLGVIGGLFGEKAFQSLGNRGGNLTEAPGGGGRYERSSGANETREQGGTGGGTSSGPVQGGL